MARIAVRRDAFEQGHFPPVCCKTGQPSDTFRRWQFSDTPTWTWILILFGVLPFLIATAFATQRFGGVLPISTRAESRIAVARRFAWVFGPGAVVLFAVGLARYNALVPLGAALAVLWLGSIVAAWFLSPNANLDGNDVVVLSNVHRGFVAALEALPHAPSPAGN